MSGDFRARLVESDRSIRIDELMQGAEVRQFVHYEDRERSRHLTALTIGRFSISIQASRTHYCEPQITTNDLDWYISWELSFWRADLLPPALAAHFDDDGIAARVPTADVQAIVDFLESIDGPPVTEPE